MQPQVIQCEWPEVRPMARGGSPTPPHPWWTRWQTASTLLTTVIAECEANWDSRLQCVPTPTCPPMGSHWPTVHATRECHNGTPLPGCGYDQVTLVDPIPPSCEGEDQLVSAYVEAVMCCPNPTCPDPGEDECRFVAEAFDCRGKRITWQCMRPTYRWKSPEGQIYVAQFPCIFNRLNMPCSWRIRNIYGPENVGGCADSADPVIQYWGCGCQSSFLRVE